MPPWIVSEFKSGESMLSTSIPSHPKPLQRGIAQKAPKKVFIKKKTKASVLKKHSVKPIKVVSKKRCISQSSKCIYHNIYYNFNLLKPVCFKKSININKPLSLFFQKKALLVLFTKFFLHILKTMPLYIAFKVPH